MPSAHLWGRPDEDAPRDPPSTLTPSPPNLCLCPLHGSLRPTTGERGGEIARARVAVASCFPLKVHNLCAHDYCLEHLTLGIHQDVTLSAFDLLASVVAALFSAYCGALDLPWESTTPALGWGSLFRRTRRRWRMARLILSQVPSMRQVLK